ncbi:MAG TPA: hypothetical protein VJR67_01855 [Candidatus Nitrosopolaris sp.]|nr:hypothetical protein [Candidatus Nitrosopolaris sp.]
MQVFYATSTRHQTPSVGIDSKYQGLVGSKAEVARSFLVRARSDRLGNGTY